MHFTLTCFTLLYFTSLYSTVLYVDSLYSVWFIHLVVIHLSVPCAGERATEYKHETDTEIPTTEQIILWGAGMCTPNSLKNLTRGGPLKSSSKESGTVTFSPPIKGGTAWGPLLPGLRNLKSPLHALCLHKHVLWLGCSFVQLSRKS